MIPGGGRGLLGFLPVQEAVEAARAGEAVVGLAGSEDARRKAVAAGGRGRCRGHHETERVVIDAIGIDGPANGRLLGGHAVDDGAVPAAVAAAAAGLVARADVAEAVLHAGLDVVVAGRDVLKVGHVLEVGVGGQDGLVVGTEQRGELVLDRTFEEGHIAVGGVFHQAFNKISHLKDEHGLIE